jgi:hypothetical protein
MNKMERGMLTLFALFVAAVFVFSYGLYLITQYVVRYRR